MSTNYTELTLTDSQDAALAGIWMALDRIADALEILTAPRIEPARPEPPAPYWARVEIMGHAKVVGLVHEERLAGAEVLRVEVPEVERRLRDMEWDDDGHLHMVGGRIDNIPAWETVVRGASLFRLTRLPEEQARREAAQLWARPFESPAPEVEAPGPAPDRPGEACRYLPGKPGEGNCQGEAGHPMCKDCAESVRRCRKCGCTERDCSGCIEKTGQPCSWIEDDLCSACVALKNLVVRCAGCGAIFRADEEKEDDVCPRCGARSCLGGRQTHARMAAQAQDEGFEDAWAAFLEDQTTETAVASPEECCYRGEDATCEKREDGQPCDPASDRLNFCTHFRPGQPGTGDCTGCGHPDCDGCAERESQTAMATAEPKED